MPPSPEELIESELFGHEKGAFTGATERRRGKFDLAHNGTLFLDEIADMSLPTQAKILRILQEQRFERVGGGQTIQVDVRVFTATNKDLENEIAAGQIQAGPLLQAQRHSHLCAAAHRPQRRYPGARGALPQALLLTEGREEEDHHRRRGQEAHAARLARQRERAEKHHRAARDHDARAIPSLADDILPLGRGPSRITDKLIGITLLKDARAEFERIFIENKLKECGNNISKTADLIGVERSNLHRKIKGLE